MLELGQFNLQFTLCRLCAQREDIQDQACSVQHPAFQRPFEVTLLYRRNWVIDDYDVRPLLLDDFLEFFDLALADKGSGMGLVAYRMHYCNDDGTRGFGEQAGFIYVEVGFLTCIGLVQDDRPVDAFVDLLIVLPVLVYGYKQGKTSWYALQGQVLVHCDQVLNV